MKKKILVTGSAGFLGSNFIRYILKESKEYEVASVDVVKRASLLHTIYSNNNHTFYMGDVCDSHFINNVFEAEKPDIVVHFAFNKTGYVHQNVKSLEIVSYCASRHNVKDFVYISDYSVYGDVNSPAKESDKLDPFGNDALAHVSNENILKSVKAVNGLDYKVLRLCDVVGPRDDFGLIPSIMKSLSNKNYLSVPFDGDAARDYIHVQDACSAIKFLIENGQKNEIYNVSLNWELSYIELTHEVINIVKEISDLDTDGFLMNLNFYNLMCRKRYSSDASKLKDLGWKNSWKFKDSLVKTIAWYDKNKWFLK